MVKPVEHPLYLKRSFFILTQNTYILLSGTKGENSNLMKLILNDRLILCINEALILDIATASIFFYVRKVILSSLTDIFKRGLLQAADLLIPLFRLCITQVAGWNTYDARFTFIDDSDSLQLLRLQICTYKYIAI